MNMTRMRAGAGILTLVSALAVGAMHPAAAQDAPPAAATSPTPAPAPARPEPKPLGDGPWTFRTEEGAIKVEAVARGLKRPWSLAFLPDGDMLVTERPGQLRLVHDGKLDPEPITGLPAIYAVGIAGLMDLALDPDYASNHLIYISYSKADPADKNNATLAVLRAKWDGGHELAEVKDIFVADAWYGKTPTPEKCCGQGPSFGSFGGRILFDPTGHLIVTSGDRNYGEMVQDPSNHFGKILRLNTDGSAARDNPFVGREGYAPEIWSTGHRNPLGLTLDSETGDLWESEFGPRGGDEVNHIDKGENYGWILVTQGHHYNGTPAEGVKDLPGYTDPVLAFGPPSLNPGNLAIYHGKAFPRWDGDMLLASFTEGLLRFDMKDGMPAGEPELMLQDLGQRWRDIKVGPGGDLWMLSDEDEGALIRISSAG